MTNHTLADLSNLSVYVAMAAVAIALVAFTIDLARTQVARVGAADEARERVLVGAGSPAAAPAASGVLAAAPRPRGAARAGMTAFYLGTFALVIAVALRGLAVSRAPWGNMYEFLLTMTMVVAVTFTALSFTRDIRWLGTFISLPVLLALGMCLVVYTEAAQLMPALKSYWLVIHVSIAFIATAVFTIGAAVGALYLFQDGVETLRRGPKGIEPTGWKAKLSAAVPSARDLDRFSHTMHIIGFPLWTFSVMAGAIWAQEAWGRYWGWDPKETWSFVIWVVYAAYLHARATTGWKIRSATVIGIVGYVCILLNFFVVNKFFVGKHSYSGM